MNAAAATPRGRLITFEGGEGAGKTTQLRRLAERLQQSGVEVVATREPGGSPVAEKLREMLLSGRVAPLGAFAEAVLFTAARIDHIDSCIAPALARGAFVLCDRFIDSTRAYQGALGQVDARTIALLEKIALGDLRADLTIILDLPAEDGLARAARRRAEGVAPDRFERVSLEDHQRLREAFLDIAAKEPDRCIIVDSTSPFEESALAIWRLVEARFLGQAA
jgi:dTMP kinase